MTKDSQTEQFSLRWNNFSNDLTTGFFALLTENDLVDVTLAVEGQCLRAHKLVLSVCSYYFKNIFKENPCQHPVIILTDVKYAEVESLLKFIYQGEINVKEEDLPAFLKLAQTLQIKGLSTEENGDTNPFSNYDNRANMDPVTQKVSAELHSDALSETYKQMEMIDQHKSSFNLTKRNAKKKQKSEPLLSESTDNFTDKKSDSTDERESSSSLNDHSTSFMDQDDVEDASVRKNDDNMKEESWPESGNAQSLVENLPLQIVEPVTYRLSARGRPQLVHEGYVYNLTSRSNYLNRSHYRCAEQHRGCRDARTPPTSGRTFPQDSHQLEKTILMDDRNRKVRRRCIYCYENLRNEGKSSAEARKHATRVTTFCSKCDTKPFMCATCFANYHTK